MKILEELNTIRNLTTNIKNTNRILLLLHNVIQDITSEAPSADCKDSVISDVNDIISNLLREELNSNVTPLRDEIDKSIDRYEELEEEEEKEEGKKK